LETWPSVIAVSRYREMDRRVIGREGERESGHVREEEEKISLGDGVKEDMKVEMRHDGERGEEKEKAADEKKRDELRKKHNNLKRCK